MWPVDPAARSVRCRGHAGCGVGELMHRPAPDRTFGGDDVGELIGIAQIFVTMLTDGVPNVVGVALCRVGDEMGLEQAAVVVGAAAPPVGQQGSGVVGGAQGADPGGGPRTIGTRQPAQRPVLECVNKHSPGAGGEGAAVSG